MAFNKDNAISISFDINADTLSAGAAYGVVLSNDYTYTREREFIFISSGPYTPSWGVSDHTWEIRAGEALQKYRMADAKPGSPDGELRITAFNSSQDKDLDIQGLLVAASAATARNFTSYDLAVYRGLFTYPKKISSFSLGYLMNHVVKYPTALGAGTLAKHCADQCELLIAGKEPGWETTDLWSTYTSVLNEFSQPACDLTWNPNLFIPRSLLTGISVMLRSSKDGVTIEQAYKAGTMVSPIHLMGANHYHGQVGEKYVFMDEAGVTYVRTVMARQWIGQLASFAAVYGNQTGSVSFDCVVSILDAEVPNCKVYQMLPEQWVADYAPESSLGYVGAMFDRVRPDLPHIRHVRHTITKKVDGINVSEPTAPGKMTMQISSITGTNEDGTSLLGAPPDKHLFINYSNLSTFSEWSHLRGEMADGDLMSQALLEGGDSGCPEFLPIDLGLGDGVDLFILGFGKTTDGITNCSNALTFINEAMQILSDGQGNTQGYQTSAPDLSQFKKYT